MNIISVDDEAWISNLLNLMLLQIKESDEQFASIHFLASFTTVQEALDYLQRHEVDLVFLDVEMPEMNGIEFAKWIEAHHIQTKIVFITAYSQYALDAWKTNAIDYILKPFDREQLQRAILKAFPEVGSSLAKSYCFRCFPKFEMMIDSRPVAFQSKRAKELLAYLIHNQGCWIDIGTLVYDLFGDLDEKSSKSHYRVILARLKKELAAYGLEKIIETKYGEIRINILPDRCDYYRVLSGGNQHLFKGEYMQDYSWAEIEKIRLTREYQDK